MTEFEMVPESNTTPPPDLAWELVMWTSDSASLQPNEKIAPPFCAPAFPSESVNPEMDTSLLVLHEGRKIRLALPPLIVMLSAPGPTMLIALEMGMLPVVSVIVLCASDAANCTVFPSLASAAAIAWRRLMLPKGPGSPVVLTMYVPAAVAANGLANAVIPSADASARASPRNTGFATCNAGACPLPSMPTPPT